MSHQALLDDARYIACHIVRVSDRTTAARERILAAVDSGNLAEVAKAIRENRSLFLGKANKGRGVMTLEIRGLAEDWLIRAAVLQDTQMGVRGHVVGA